MNSYKQLLLTLLLTFFVPVANADVTSKTLWVAQKSAGAAITVCTVLAWRDILLGAHGVGHQKALMLPSLVTGLNLVAGRNFLPQGKVGTALTALGGVFVMNQIKRSLGWKGLTTYDLSTIDSKLDAVLLSAATVQALSCFQELYKRARVLRAVKNEMKTTSSTPPTLEKK